MVVSEQMLVAILALASFQIGLMLFALYDLWRRREVRYLPKYLWAVIVIIFNFAGPLSYLLLGRKSPGEESQ
jgi:hypothetical protein